MSDNPFDNPFAREPWRETERARRVCERGIVVSEYEPGIEPAPWRFPARKRRGCMDKRIPLRQAVVCAVDVAKCHAGVVPVWSRDSRQLRQRL